MRALSKLLDSPNGSARKQTVAALTALGERGIETAREALAEVARARETLQGIAAQRQPLVKLA